MTTVGFEIGPRLRWARRAWSIWLSETTLQCAFSHRRWALNISGVQDRGLDVG